MNHQLTTIAARGLTDDGDRLIRADEPFAELQEACGGRVPGVLAVPELLELVRQCRTLGLRIARNFSAFDGRDIVTGFARIRAIDDQEDDSIGEGGGCEILIENWSNLSSTEGAGGGFTQLYDAADRTAANVTGQLDGRQRLQFITAHDKDTKSLEDAFVKAPGRSWTEYIELLGITHEQPLHWRLLDGAKAKIPGSQRSWRVRLLPLGPTASAPLGFELLLIADEPLNLAHTTGLDQNNKYETEHSRLIGSALTPVLRQPIARIIANAETIHTRLAGPLREEYSEYASNIAAAGQHLSGMLDDLADLEVVEAPGFETTKEQVDLLDIAKRSSGILGVRAQARDIKVHVKKGAEGVFAQAEFRRVLQILLNLIGNAIAYSPEGSEVEVELSSDPGGLVGVIVRDQGPGLTQEQAAKVFNKFERLGRDSDGGNDGGSGLGLFISRKLALAMGGDLEVLPPQLGTELVGAEFKLSLPAYPTE